MLAAAVGGGVLAAQAGFAAFGSSHQATATYSSATLAAPTGLAVQQTPAVTLSWTATSSSFATGTRVYRSVTSGGPYTQIAQLAGLGTTSYGDAPGAGTFYYVARAYRANWTSATSNQAARQDSNFVFAASTGFIGTNCASAQVSRDMIQGYTPTGSPSSWHRTGGTGTVSFCSDTFVAGQSMSAGTATVSGYYDNASGASCTITVSLYRNSTLLGSSSVFVPAGTTATLRPASFTTPAVSFATGDRLNVFVSWGSTKSCDSTNLYWNGATTPSKLTVPAMP